MKRNATRKPVAAPDTGIASSMIDRSVARTIAAAKAGLPLYVLNPQRVWIPASETSRRIILGTDENDPSTTMLLNIYGTLKSTVVA